MSQETQAAEEKRLVAAPAAGPLDGPAAVLSVQLSEGEEVRWQWTHFPDGRSLVTGFEIIRKTPFDFQEAVSAWLWSEEEKGGNAARPNLKPATRRRAIGFVPA